MLTSYTVYSHVILCTVLFSLIQYSLQLFNGIGTIIEAKYIEMEPVFLAMTKTHVVVASREAFYTWQFKNPKKLVNIEISGKRKAGMEKYVNYYY